MPLERCTKNGESGWRWGSKGACYLGPGGKKKALAQGLAENKGNEKAFREELSKAGLLEDLLVQEYLQSLEPTGSSRYLLAVGNHLEESHAYISVEERDKMSPEDFGDPKNKRYPVKDQKHLDLAWRLSGREAPAKQKAIRQRLKAIAKRKGLKLPSTAK